MNEKLLWVSDWLKGAYHMSELAAGQNSPVVEPDQSRDAF